jgi:hypothetical protein
MAPPSVFEIDPRWDLQKLAVEFQSFISVNGRWDFRVRVSTDPQWRETSPYNMRKLLSVLTEYYFEEFEVGTHEPIFWVAKQTARLLPKPIRLLNQPDDVQMIGYIISLAFTNNMYLGIPLGLTAIELFKTNPDHVKLIAAFKADSPKMAEEAHTDQVILDRHVLPMMEVMHMIRYHSMTLGGHFSSGLSDMALREFIHGPDLITDDSFHFKFIGTDTRIANWLADIIPQLSADDKHTFSEFVCGSPHPPMEQDGPWFTINVVDYQDNDSRLFISTKIRSTIEVPLYSSLDIMKDRLMETIRLQDGSLFEY